MLRLVIQAGECYVRTNRHRKDHTVTTPILRDVRQPMLSSVSGRADLHPATFDVKGTLADSVKAKQSLGKLGSSRADQSGKTDNLSPPHDEVDVLHLRSSARH